MMGYRVGLGVGSPGEGRGGQGWRRISSTLRRDSSASGVAAVTQRRRKRGRLLIFSFCRASSSQSCSTMQKLVPAGARSTNCGLSTKLVCVRSPPAVCSPQLPTAHAPQKPNSAEPGSAATFCFLRSIEEESARACLGLGLGLALTLTLTLTLTLILTLTLTLTLNLTRLLSEFNAQRMLGR